MQMLQTVALMGVFGFGIVSALIGALKIDLAKVLEINDAEVGGLISALMVSCTAVVLTAGLLVDVVGHKWLASVGFLTASASLFLLVSVNSYPMALLACLFLGAGGQCVNVVGSTLLPMVLFEGKNAPAAMNLGTTFYGLGAFMIPSLTGALRKHIGYRATGCLIALFLFVPTAFALTTAYPPAMRGVTVLQGLGFLTDNLIVMVSVILFCGLGLQASMGTWITTYGRSVGFRERSLSMILSLFWIGFMVGRLIASSLVNLEIGAMAIAGLSALAALSIAVTVIFRSKTAAYCYIAAGLATGPILPTATGIAFGHTPVAYHGTVFGIIFTIGYLGASTIPALVGIVSRKKTIYAGLRITIVATLVILFTALIIDRFYP
jgi:fucose permease